MTDNDLDDIATAHLDQRETTHWHGCHLTHTACAIAKLLDEVKGLRARVDMLETALRPFANSYWRDVHPGQPMKDGGFFLPKDTDRARRALDSTAPDQENNNPDQER